MMRAKGQKLTPREQAYVEHARRAREAGETLSRYCQRRGLKVGSLYEVKRQLVRKGLLPRSTAQPSGRSRFVAVQVASAERDGNASCRLRHPSGWLIECGSLPPVAWLTALIEGGGDAAA